MKKDFVTVVYDRRKRVEVTGEGTVELNIYLSRSERKYVALRLCNPIAWKKYQKSEELKREVAIYKMAIERMQERNEDMTIENLNRHMGLNLTTKEKVEKQKKIASKHGFLDFMRETIATEKLAKATLQRKNLTIDAMIRYGHLSSFGDLTDKNVKGFDDFLRAETERTLPTLHNYHKILKMYTRLAMQLGYIIHDPYDSPLCKFERGKYKERQPLTEEELVVLREAELEGKLARVRDLFVFCAYTGLSYADSQVFCYKGMKEDHFHYYVLDDETTIDGGAEMYQLHVSFVAEIERRGYIIDNIYRWGKKLGMPHNGRLRVYNKKNLVELLGSKPAQTVKGAENKGFTIHETFSSYGEIDGTRLLQLLVIPQGASTSRIDIKAMKTMIVGISGKGMVKASGRIISHHLLGTDIYNPNSDSCLIDDHFSIHASVNALRESKKPEWVQIENTRDQDLQMLLIREIDTCPTLY